MTERLLRENREANGGAVRRNLQGVLDGLDQPSGARGDFELPRLSAIRDTKGCGAAGNVGTRGHISSAPCIDVRSVNLLADCLCNRLRGLRC